MICKKVISLIGILILVNICICSSTAMVRQKEMLNRSLIVQKVSNGCYLNWRLFDSEDYIFGTSNANTTFNIYKNNLFLANVDSTNYIDTSGTTDTKYKVAPVVNNIEGALCANTSAFLSESNYFDIPLQKPDDFVLGSDTAYPYTVGDGSVGDLDGDGEYEIIIKWDSNAQDNSNAGITGNVILEAYKFNGTRLWRIDLGRNIRSGAHYTQFLVYDFDNDGKAEITCKTAPGSKDGNGVYVSQASRNSTIKAVDDTVSYVNKSGFITEGDEFYTVFKGIDGSAIDTVYYPFSRYPANGWGKAGDTTNRVDRFLACVAYLDGVIPSMITGRGYYGRTTFAALNLVNQRLQLVKSFDSNLAGTQFGGQGNHNITVADVDNDGKDEILAGSLCLDDDFSVKWCSFRGHGDALHIGDYDPTHEGLEYFSVHESGNWVNEGVSLDYGMTVYDAKTGAELYHKSAGSDTGRGVMANVGAGGYYQFWASTGAGSYAALGNNKFQTAAISGVSYNFRVFWDGDLYDELLDKTVVSSCNGGKMEAIFTAKDCNSINGTKATPMLTADILGDWREELVYPTTDNTKLRIFTTNIPTLYKVKTLMHDNIYRSGVAAENTGYNQPPHIGFYLNEDLYKPKMIDIQIIAPTKTQYNVGEELDLTGLTVTVSYVDDSREEITNYFIAGYNKNAAGVQTITVNYKNYSKTFHIYVHSGFTINQDGYITGYSGVQAEEILPTSMDDKKVTGFLNNALINTSIQKLTILADEMSFLETVFDSDIIIRCYKGSDAQIYAEVNGLDFALLEAGELVIAKTDFSEPEYSGMSMLQNTTAQTKTVGDFTYEVGNKLTGPDYSTGFQVIDGYLLGRVGRLNTTARNAVIKIPDSPIIDPNYEYTLSMDVYFEAHANRTAQMTFGDGTNSILTINKNTFGTENKWYNFRLLYSDGKLYQIIKDETGTETTTQLHVQVYEKFISSITVSKLAGTYSGSEYASVRIDNLSITMPEMYNVSIRVKDEFNMPVYEADIVMNGKTYKTDLEGKFTKNLRAERYFVTVGKASYVDNAFFISNRADHVEKEIILMKEAVLISDIQLLREEITLKKDMVYYVDAKIFPENATENYSLEASDDSIAQILDNHCITAKNTGSTTIYVQSENITKNISVTVIENNYTPVAARMEIESNFDTIYKSAADKITSDTLRAVVYDQNHVEMYGTPVSFFVSGNNGVTIEQNNEFASLSVLNTANTGNVVITASGSGKSVNKTIEISDRFVQEEIFTSSDFSDSVFSNPALRLVMGAAAQTDSRGGFTFGVGARGDGDSSTEIKFNTNLTCIEAVGGRFSDNERHAYMMINDSPVFGDGAYVFEADFTLVEGSAEKEMQIVLSDNDYNITITSISITANNLVSNRKYNYKFIYEKGTYIEYITDSITGKTTEKTLISTAAKINKISFKTAGGTASIHPRCYIHNVKLYKIPSVTSALTLYIRDANGKQSNEAEILLAGEVFHTNEYGAFSLQLENGIYNAEITVSDKTYNKTLVLGGKTYIYIINTGVAAKHIMDAAGYYYLLTDSSAKAEATVIYTNFSADRLTDIINSSLKIPKGKYLLPISFNSFNKIFIWDDFNNLKPAVQE